MSFPQFATAPAPAPLPIIPDGVPPIITIDFETYYCPKNKRGHPDAGYGLRTMMTQEYVYDPRFKVHGASFKPLGQPAYWVSGANIQEHLDYLGAQIPWSQRAVVGHNLRFDGLILSRHYDVVPKQYIDTLGMSRAHFGASIKSHGLDETMKALGRPGKIGGGDVLARCAGIRDLPISLEFELAEYAIKDADDAEFILKTLAPQFPMAEYEMLDAITRMAAEPKLELDLAAIRRCIKAALEKDQAVLDKAKAFAPRLTPTMCRSGEKFAPLWTQITGFEAPKKWSKKKDKVTGKYESYQTWAFAKDDAEFFEQMQASGPGGEALYRAKLAFASNIQVSRLRRMERLALGRGKHGQPPKFAVPINYSGALNTHRGSGADSLNMQNLPRTDFDEFGEAIETLRHCIKAPDGYRIVVFDSSGIEFIIAMALSGQWDVLARRAEGVREYSVFASKVYGRPINKNDDPIEDTVGKIAVLQLQYGAGWAGFTKSLFAVTDGKIVMGEEEGKKVVTTYRTEYLEVVKFWRALDGVLNQMLAGVQNPQINVAQRVPVTFNVDGFTLPSGLRVKYPNLRREMIEVFDSKTGEKKMKSSIVYDDARKPGGKIGLYSGKFFENICQALASEVVDEQLMEVQREFPTLSLQVHDEGGFCVLRADAERCYALANRAMSKRPVWWPELPVACAGDYAVVYGDAK